MSFNPADLGYLAPFLILAVVGMLLVLAEAFFKGTDRTALVGLTVGGLNVAVPFIPIFIDEFAFFLAFCGWFYPDLKKLMHDYGYTRRLNAIVTEAARYQRRSTTEYLTASSLDRMLTSGTNDHKEKRA